MLEIVARCFVLYTTVAVTSAGIGLSSVPEPTSGGQRSPTIQLVYVDNYGPASARAVSSAKAPMLSASLQ